jgi:hypothetical protein
LTAREIAERGLILRVMVGSTVHGLHHEGHDDRDEMGITCEPESHVVGLGRFDHYTYRSKPNGVRSGPGDLDLTVYGLRKWAKLATQGNITVLLPLFVPDEAIMHAGPEGAYLRKCAQVFISRRVGARIAQYMQSQRSRLLGEQGQMNAKRPELVTAYGYDTKYAMHLLRLGYQGHELLSRGTLTLPMSTGKREHIMAVRNGQVRLDDVIEESIDLEQAVLTMANAEGSEALPAEPDAYAVDDLLIALYESRWARMNSTWGIRDYANAHREYVRNETSNLVPSFSRIP